MLCALWFSSCEGKKQGNEHLNILERSILKDLPSASGIEIIDDHVYVISDNTPWLYELDADYKIKDTLLIAPNTNLQGEIFEKDTKFDFEGIATFQDSTTNLLIFGSGSKSLQRNKLVWLKKDDSISSQVYDLSAFYQEIIKSTAIGKENMNLEGISIENGKLFLFNRGNNSIWEFSLQEFLSYLENEKHAFPKFERHSIELPIFNGVQAGFSGATELDGTSRIIFTASLEDTENWVDDGDVLGSYVGIIELDELNDAYRPKLFPLEAKGKMLKLKVESVAIKSEMEQAYRLLLVTDSDGGNSELLEASFWLD